MRTEEARHRRQRRLAHLLDRARPLHRARGRRRCSSCGGSRGAGASRGRTRSTSRTARTRSRPPPSPEGRREQGRRRRRDPLGRGHALRRLRRRRLRRRLLDAASGDGERADRARRLIDSAIGPVWEANHVWLIFILVVLWTAFSVAFEAIMSTLFIPLSLAALGSCSAGRALPSTRSSERERAQLRRAPVRRLVGDHALLHGHRRRCDRLRPGAGRQRRGRPMVELAQPGFDPGRRPVRRDRCLPGRGLSDHRRAPRRRRGPRSTTSGAARM